MSFIITNQGLNAMREVLAALVGPGHLIRELQATRTLPANMGGAENPINVLISFSASAKTAPAHFIHLTPAEIQSGHDRVRWAEGLIKQLPDDHDGRNSWLLNYGTDKDARQNGKPQPVIQHVPVDDTEGGAL